MTRGMSMAAAGVMIVAAAMGVPASAAAPQPGLRPQAEAQALDLAKKAIALRSVTGQGNQTGQVAALFKQALVDSGFPADAITITPVDDTAYFIARWKGLDAKLKPLVISGHMDVVAANPKDWQRDPFTPLVENGYLFGRGASDMKLDGAMAVTALAELKRQGFAPRRDIVLEFSGDEETAMKTSAILADQLKNAELVLNIDGGGGMLDADTGKPLYWVWTAAEKTYADFELSVTNPGGHSSAPRAVNAIYQLSAALTKVGNYQFKPELNAITRASLASAARYEEPKTAAAMRAFVADPADRTAIATLTANPATVGRIGTTCVATMVDAGHAQNALPQRATANINCRIFPGHKPADIMAELARVIGDPAVKIRDVSEGSVATDASPLRPDVSAAVERALHQVYPGVPVFPGQASGASDSMWYRAKGIPSYSISPIFMKDADDFSHGLNERVPVFNIAPGVRYYMTLFSNLSQ
ncbi:M20/M25/M40 family metallo-hydrolase [uncultured Sphingomonas sp.]|uniref:M20/M25/M40 family metallo-hydrolase n=1 Tax=uncultured Sphingomonas sp. TaxID=158754 RepID=UPI0025CDAB7E|nr:M20/M25/M40 family metallo-hydrolase [uncultured Sphingomonas sp.]